jgi:alkanesulfonate monooxygenase SsuD/methylene tetrahydromethanopterin reductase-like flavin-dependent oxidoreductase (luciferase family)
VVASPSKHHTEIGYSLSSEEHPPGKLVEYAQAAESTGFTFALISDHFHPWTDKQGSSPFVWSVLGAIAVHTKQLVVGTGVTCPIMRIHPAVIAHAAATTACLMPGRFFLGVGSGESLNEHITGQAWPPPDVRQDMLEEAVQVLRLLHEGGERSHYGKFFQVHDARIYNLPDRPVRPEDVASNVICGPDPQRHLEGIAKFVKAGFDHVYVHQVGPDQQGFMRFYEHAILPNLKEIAA